MSDELLPFAEVGAETRGAPKERVGGLFALVILPRRVLELEGELSARSKRAAWLCETEVAFAPGPSMLPEGGRAGLWEQEEEWCCVRVSDKERVA